MVVCLFKNFCGNHFEQPLINLEINVARKNLTDDEYKAIYDDERTTAAIGKDYWISTTMVSIIKRGASPRLQRLGLTGKTSGRGRKPKALKAKPAMTKMGGRSKFPKPRKRLTDDQYKAIYYSEKTQSQI